MRNELDDAFERTRAENRAALIPYLTAGYPDPKTYVEMAVAMLEASADALEIGIPFSDPLLDGLATQRSQHAALEAGVTLVECLRFAREIRERTDKPLLFMGAYNPIFAYGLERLAADAAAAGVTGLIVPDLPIEEQDELRDAVRVAGIHLIQLLAPTSTEERVARVCRAASGFVYGISVAGVTGARSAGVSATAEPLVARIRECTDVPVAVGFGIAGPAQARDVGRYADGVAVGSALTTAVGEASPEDAIRVGREMVAALAEALATARESGA